MANDATTASFPTQTALSMLEEALRDGLDKKNDQQLEDIEGMVRASLSELLSVLYLDVAEHVEPFIKDCKKAYFSVREGIASDYRRDPVFYLGEIAAIAELAQIARTQAIPSDAAKIMVNSDVARDIAKVVLTAGALRPTDLAERLEKHSQNVLKVTASMVKTGLLRRDNFGKSVMYSATPLTRAALAYVEYVGTTPASLGSTQRQACLAR